MTIDNIGDDCVEHVWVSGRMRSKFYFKSQFYAIFAIHDIRIILGYVWFKWKYLAYFII